MSCVRIGGKGYFTLADEIDDLVGTPGFGGIEQFGALPVAGGEIRFDDTESVGDGGVESIHCIH